MNFDNLLNPEAFWQYSCELYAKPGVKQRCLAAQNELTLNVNIILLCQWLYCHSKSMTVEDFLFLRSRITASEALLKEQRQQRNEQVKDSIEYKNALSIELALEKAQQATLIESLQHIQLVNSARHSLLEYVQACDLNITPEIEQLKQALEHKNL